MPLHGTTTCLVSSLEPLQPLLHYPHPAGDTHASTSDATISSAFQIEPAVLNTLFLQMPECNLDLLLVCRDRSIAHDNALLALIAGPLYALKADRRWRGKAAYGHVSKRYLQQYRT